MSMVTVDQSMGGSAEIDYADFATQQVSVAFFSDDGSGVARGSASVEPLRGRGGLANNEVAELLYLETEVDLAQLEFSGGNDQDVATSTEFKGAIGINLPQEVGDALVEFGGVDIDTDGPRGNVAGFSITDNAYLQQFRTVSGLHFDDQDSSGGGGPGGSYTNDAFHAEKYYRQTHGRGPVLDQTDDINVVADVQTRDSVVDVRGLVNLTMYWDVAETSDAGRRFSVP